MNSPLVSDPNRIRLAMLGMVEGNGHPYSWSAIINGGFDAATIKDCPYAAIPQYLRGTKGKPRHPRRGGDAHLVRESHRSRARRQGQPHSQCAE